MTKAKSKKTHDWDAIEREYSLGQKSLRTLSAEFGPTPGAISKRASKGGWVQDKTAEVRQKTAAALLQETPTGNTPGNTPSREDVDRAVQTNVQVVREHRKDVKAGREMVETLLEQLKDAAGLRDEIVSQIDAETESSGKDGQPDYKRRNMLKKAVSLPAHAGVVKDLSVTLKNLIPLERQAFNLDDDSTANALKALAARFSPATRQMISELLGDDK